MPTPSSSSQFRPHFLAINGLAHTLLSSRLYKRRRFSETREIVLQLADEDQIVMLADNTSATSEKRGTVLLIHGLGSSAHDPLLTATTYRLLKQGYDVLRMNHRGVANGSGKAKTPYHAGRDEDVGAVLAQVSEMLPPGESLFVVSFSLSSNMTLKHLGQSKPHLPKLKGVVCVSPIWDLKSSSKLISQSYFGVLNTVFLKAIERYFVKFAQTASEFEAPDFKIIKTLKDLDEKFIAKLAGHATVDDYYQKSSAGPWIESIEVPTVLLMAKDDPIASVESSTVFKNPHVKRVVYKTGGHLGFVARDSRSLKMKLWLDQEIVRQLNQFELKA